MASVSMFFFGSRRFDGGRIIDDEAVCIIFILIYIDQKFEMKNKIGKT